MSLITLTIQAETAIELKRTIAALGVEHVTLTTADVAHPGSRPVEELVKQEQSYQEDNAAREELQEKRTRRTKAQIAADEAAALAAKQALAKADADPFGAQIKEAVAEASAEENDPFAEAVKTQAEPSSAAPTVQDVRSAMSKYLAGEGHSASRMVELVTGVCGGKVTGADAIPEAKRAAVIEALGA